MNTSNVRSLKNDWGKIFDAPIHKMVVLPTIPANSMREAGILNRLKRKKGTRLGAFLLVARRGFPHLLISLGYRRLCAIDVPDDVPKPRHIVGHFKPLKTPSSHISVGVDSVDGEVLAVFTHVLFDATLVRLEVQVPLHGLTAGRARAAPTDLRN